MLFFGKNKEKKPSRAEQVQEEINRVLAENNFNPTSSYKQDAPFLSTHSWIMFVDSQSKRIAFVNKKVGKPVTFFDFDKIRSCEIQQVDEGSTATGGAMGFGGGALGAGKTITNVRYVRMFINVNDIDKPSFEVFLGGLCSSASSQYLRAINFANKVKMVIDNIVSMQGKS